MICLNNTNYPISILHEFRNELWSFVLDLFWPNGIPTVLSGVHKKSTKNIPNWMLVCLKSREHVCITYIKISRLHVIRGMYRQSMFYILIICFPFQNLHFGGPHFKCLTILLWVLSIYPFIKHYTIVVSIITI